MSDEIRENIDYNPQSPANLAKGLERLGDEAKECRGAVDELDGRFRDLMEQLGPMLGDLHQALFVTNARLTTLELLLTDPEFEERRKQLLAGAMKPEELGNLMMETIVPRMRDAYREAMETARAAAESGGEGSGEEKPLVVAE